jgi:hypothetical protein
MDWVIFGCTLAEACPTNMSTRSLGVKPIATEQPKLSITMLQLLEEMLEEPWGIL